MEGDKPWSPAYVIYASHFTKGPIATEDQIIQKNLLSGQMQSRCSKEGNSFSEVEVSVKVAATVGQKMAQLHCDKPRSCEN